MCLNIFKRKLCSFFITRKKIIIEQIIVIKKNSSQQILANIYIYNKEEEKHQDLTILFLYIRTYIFGREKERE